MDSANIISNAGSCADGLRKKTAKSNRRRIFAHNCLDRYIFFLDLELEHAFFYVKRCLLEIPQISLISWAISLQRKSLLFFLILIGIHYLPLDRFYHFRKLVLVACISKRIFCFSLFICHIRETREHYQWKFKVNWK